MGVSSSLVREARQHNLPERHNLYDCTGHVFKSTKNKRTLIHDYGSSSLSDRTEVYLGDENPLALTFNARNEGEGGAYEAELYVVLPPEADYSGIARNNVVRGTQSLCHQSCLFAMYQ